MKLYRKLCYTILILLLISLSASSYMVPVEDEVLLKNMHELTSPGGYVPSTVLWPTPNKEAVKKVIEANKIEQIPNNYTMGKISDPCMDLSDIVSEKLYDGKWAVAVNGLKIKKNYHGCDIMCINTNVLVINCRSSKGTIIIPLSNISMNVIISRMIGEE